jgi:hypothetical protein
MDKGSVVAGKRDETQMIWRDYVELCREYVLTAEERHLWRSKYDAIRVDAIALYSVHVHQMDALYLSMYDSGLHQDFTETLAGQLTQPLESTPYQATNP